MATWKSLFSPHFVNLGGKFMKDVRKIYTIISKVKAEWNPLTLKTFLNDKDDLLLRITFIIRSNKSKNYYDYYIQGIPTVWIHLTLSLSLSHLSLCLCLSLSLSLILSLWAIAHGKLATVVEVDKKATAIATTLSCMGGCYYFPWIAPLYHRYVPYIAEC